MNDLEDLAPPDELMEMEGQGHSINFFFVCVAIAMLIAGVSGAALSFDGSNYLFQILDSQAPHTPNDRLVNVPLHLPVILASHLTSNMSVLGIVFSLIYATIPLLALVASWWIVRKRAPHLFVWPVLCIGLATLPGQFYLVSEAMYAMHLTWPVVLAILVRAPARYTPVVALCAVAILVSHPFAVVLLGFAVGLAILQGWLYKGERERMWEWAFGLGVVLIIAVISFLFTSSGYESAQLSFEVLTRDFKASVVGFPLISLLFIWLATLALLVEVYLRYRMQFDPLPMVMAVEFAGIAIAGLLLFFWASRADRWVWASGYRPTALANTLVFMAIATGDSLLRKFHALDANGSRSDWLHRSRTVQVTSIAFFLVLGAQSLTWTRVTDKLNETMSQSSWSCTSQSSIGWLSETPLSWTTPVYSILIQSRSPERIVLPADGCSEERLGAEVVLAEQFAPRSWDGGWFHLEPLKERLVAEREKAAHGCWWQLPSGWYSAQQELSSDYWWRWSAGNGQLRIFIENEASVTLNGEIESIEQPNQVDILLNGANLTTLDITWFKMRPMGPVEVPLEAGENVIAFVSRNPSITLERGDRPLAFAIANLEVLNQRDGSLCEFRS